MDIRVTTDGSIGKLHMQGRFDFNVHQAFRDAYTPLLEQNGINTLEIDLAEVEYLDSSALGMLLLVRERAEAAGKKVDLLCPNSTVGQILEIANFRKLFTIR
jgi:HptB-dependent secretion and biofilm anti anti-sigma factor